MMAKPFPGGHEAAAAAIAASIPPRPDRPRSHRRIDPALM
jgi:hypothetical protein